MSINQAEKSGEPPGLWKHILPLPSFPDSVTAMTQVEALICIIALHLPDMTNTLCRAIKNGILSRNMRRKPTATNQNPFHAGCTTTTRVLRLDPQWKPMSLLKSVILKVITLSSVLSGGTNTNLTLTKLDSYPEIQGYIRHMAPSATTRPLGHTDM